MKNSCYILNRVFLVALFTLLINDFYLKSEFPSFITGKLSDVSGLVVFVLLLTFLFGKQKQVAIIAFTVLLFCWWKSPWSSEFIHSWNHMFIFYSIDRTIDYSDLICLFFLIPTYFYKPEKQLVSTNYRWITTPILFLTIFAITATSKARNIPAYDSTYTYRINESFKLKMTHAEFLKDLSFSNVTLEKNKKTPKRATNSHHYILRNFTIRDGLIVESMYISVKEKNNHIKLFIYDVSLVNPPVETAKALKKQILNETKELFALGN